MSAFGTPDDLAVAPGFAGTMNALLRTLSFELNTLGVSGDALLTAGAAGTVAAQLRTIANLLQGGIATGPATGTIIDRSGTVTIANTAQTLAPANPVRKYLFIQNLSSSGDLWINFGVTAIQSQPSLRMPPNSVFTMEGSFVSTDSISAIGPTVGQPFAAKAG